MKKICITWASRGIWLEEALLLQEWNELYLWATSIDSFNTKWLENCHLFWFDLTALDDITNFANDIKKQTDTLDVLVNNVWVMIMKKFEDYSEEDINFLIDINLRAAIILTKKLLPLLLNSNNPQIIFMSSMAAKSSINGESVYAASKAWLTNFANVLRNELGDKIQISTIHSWWVNTFWANESVPLLWPKDIANVVGFVIDCPKPMVIESVDLSHQLQWRGWKAPWSPA